jgi:hypothetical protein
MGLAHLPLPPIPLLPLHLFFPCVVCVGGGVGSGQWGAKSYYHVLDPPLAILPRLVVSHGVHAYMDTYHVCLVPGRHCLVHVACSGVRL